MVAILAQVVVPIMPTKKQLEEALKLATDSLDNSKKLVEELSKRPSSPASFMIPEDITDPEQKLTYALSDLAGHVERLSKRDETGGSGDFRYTFTSIFDMIDQVRPLLFERGLYMWGTMALESDQYVRTKFTTGSNREGTDLRLPVEWTIENYYGASLSITVLGEARDTTDKATGKAFTASQKIALRSFCGLSTGDPEDTEQESIESLGAGAPAKAQGGSTANQRGVRITKALGVCPIHDVPFVPPSKKAQESGFGASHKEGDGWCQYGEVREGYEAEVGPMIKAKLGDLATWVTWLEVNASAANLTYIAAMPRKVGGYRPQDWHFIRKALEAMPEKDGESVVEEEQSFCEVLVDDKPCRLVAEHPDYIAHSAKPTLQEIQDAKDAKADEGGSEDAEANA